MPKYNHMYTIAFEVSGSTTDTGEDVTEIQLLAALRKRANDLERSKGEIIEATGWPEDSYEEDSYEEEKSNGI
tara:strand:- start:262 stop:480 length:219 start_codon:yes stop_codon:yes gene_type:complete